MAHTLRIVTPVLRMTTGRVILLALLVGVSLTMVCGGHFHQGYMSSVHIAIFGEPHIHLDNDLDHDSIDASHADDLDHAPHSTEHTAPAGVPLSPQDAGASWVSSHAGELSLVSMMGVALFFMLGFGTGS